MKHRSLCFSLVMAAVLLVSFAPTASAAGNFTCRASALRITSPLANSEAVVANKNNNPCADDSAQLLNAGVPGLATATTLNAATDNRTDGATSTASAATANVALAGRVISATVLNSRADVTCLGGSHGVPFHPDTPGSPAFSGSSSVATVSISGLAPIVVTGQPNQTIKIPADGSILEVVINEQIQTSDRITVRALRVSSPLLNTTVVVAESIADVSGTPCA